jgi:predicted Abi (CAAX) family protease
MRNLDGRTNAKVRRICQDINHRANDRQKLQTLVIELQELLREDCCGREDWHNAAALRRNLQPDDPFDKLIMVA